MRKTIIALILVLPMIFVLVIFSSVNLISLGVPVPVTGITIRSEDADQDGTIVLDMADKLDHTVSVEVSPSNATNKGFTLGSNNEKVVEVTQEGKIVPKGEGTAEIVATSNDKSFTDSMTVVIYSTEPYDFDFTLYRSTDGAAENLLTETEEGYTATVPTGTYSYGMSIYPIEYTQYKLEAGSDSYATEYAEIERGTKTIFLPFTGEAVFDVYAVDSHGDATIRKQVKLNVTKPAVAGETEKEVVAVVNGGAVYADSDGNGIFADDVDGSMQLARGTTAIQLCVESAGGRPSFESRDANLVETVGQSGQYILMIEFTETDVDEIAATITAFGKRIPFLFSFVDFTFSVFSDRTIDTTDDGGLQVTIFTGNAVSFYTVASGGAKGVDYTWEFTGSQSYFQEEDGVVTITAQRGGEFDLSVTARYGEAEPITKTIHLIVINKISAVKINNDVKVDLAQCYTVAGFVYGDSFRLTENVYPLAIYIYNASGVVDVAGEDIVYSVDDDTVAEVDTSSGSPVLVPKGTGKVTVTAAWRWNAALHTNVQATLTLNVVKDAVAVKNAPELVKATDDGRAVVLTENIKLGTDASGKDFSIDERLAVLKNHRAKSTYNVEWYKHTSDPLTEADAYISYALEFTNDVYGNGKSIDADNYTHAHDANGKPLLDLYKGPLYFVKYKQTASVAAQDNCAFLLRTDGVKLYGVNLLGCSDSSLENENGEYDLTNLNLVGTTLEINASCEIVNCRISNGRNVVRAYGGNRDGAKYFINSLTENNAGVDKDRIVVTIEGCILSQGREFILKMGANRALRANNGNGREPQLRDKNGRPYSEQGTSNVYGDGKLYDDPWFYQHYVMTDVTLKDSVVETSGLFTVGIESNFAGEYLYEGGESYNNGLTKEWEFSGGTSFASVLRLVGDVRLYDWKDLSLVDSSSLIESPIGALSAWLKLDIKAMIDYVCKDAAYSDIIETAEGKQYVHGGIALYGGGRNYSAVDMSKLDASLNDFLQMRINISVLAGGSGAMQQQGTLLPKAAGTQDFNFYMYGKNGANNYVKQLSDEQKGLKYKGVQPVSAF